MTIDEYLNQLKTIQSAERKAYDNVVKKHNIATRSTSLFSPMPRIKTGENRYETKLLEFIDAKNEWEAINKRYFDVRDQMWIDFNNLHDWECKLLYQLYIHNLAFPDKDYFYGVDEILETTSMNVIRAKLKEAKIHLREILIAQGMDIE